MAGLLSPYVDHPTFIAPGPQRDTEDHSWFDLLILLILFLGVMFGLCTLVYLDFLLVDEARCVLFIFIGTFCWYASKFETRNPQLAHFTVSVTPHPSVWKARFQIPRTPHLRQYHLWRRICRRLTARPVLPFGFEWDPSEYFFHFKYCWISDSRSSIGPHVISFCRYLDPIGHFRRGQRYLKPTVVQPRHENFHDDWAVLTRNKFLFKDYLFPSEEEGEEKPSNSSQYQKLHLPMEQYGPYFYTFVDTLNPLLVLSLLKNDFIQTTKVKTKYDAINTPAQVYDNDSADPDNDAIVGITRHWMTEAAYILAIDLQSAGRSATKSCYWANDDSSIPIIIDTGASVSVSPNEADFIGPIMAIPGGKKIEGLNSQVQVEGHGRVRWTDDPRYY
jgi:hypothetical protein